MKISSIQVYESTKKKLAQKKVHPRESYDSVVNRLLKTEEIPSMEDMFKQGDKIKQKKQYSTREVLKLTHDLRNK